DRDRRRAGLPPAAALPLPLLHARRRPLRAAMSQQPRPAASDRGDPDLPAAQDREGQRQPAAGTGPGGERIVTPGNAAAGGVAVVTGGSAGIGKAICLDLLAQGYEVVSLARRRCELDHGKLHSIEVDLTDRQ